SASNSGFGRLVVVISVEELVQRVRDLTEANNEVDVPGGYRGAGHAGKLRTPFVLDNHGPAHLFYRTDAHCTVTAAAGENNGYGPLLEARRDGLEEQVRRGTDEMDELRVSQREGVVRTREQVPVGRRHYYESGEECIAFLGLLDSEVRVPSEDVGHQA